MKKLTALTMILVLTASSQDQRPALFFTTDAASVSLSSIENSSLTRILEKPIYQLGYKIVTLNNFEALQGADAITIDIDGQNLVLSHKKESHDVLGNTTLVLSSGPDKYALITKGDAQVFVFVQLSEKLYNILPLSSRYSVLLEIDNKLLREAVRSEDEQRMGDGVTGLNGSNLLKESTLRKTLTTSGVNIDVLVAYTPAADSVYGGNILSLISQAIQQTNTTYSNSEVDLTLTLVHAVEVNYAESGLLETDVDLFAGTSDGEMDEVHALRNQYGADLCVLITATGDYAGWAKDIGAVFTTAFCAAVADYAVNNITFAHEIGHLLGGRHQFGLDNNGTINHGYYHDDETPANRWRTVMAVYNDRFGPTDTRIPYWSTPSAYYAGSPRGDQNSIMTSQLENYAPTVAAFSPHMVSGTISSNTTWVEDSYMSGNVTVASGATLTVSPGLTITSLGPYKLRIEGKLVANGNSNNRLTFTRSGGQWYGIEFYYNYGSGSSIQYADITNAQYGVSSYGTDTYLTNNKILFNSVGVYVSGSINSMNWNLFENNTYGVQCTNYGDANIQTNNVIRYNGWGVHGDWTSAPALGSLTGYNSLYFNDYYDVYSDYGGTIYARGNWWGSYPAAPIVTPNVDYSSELSVDPNSWANGSAALTDGPTLEKSLQKVSMTQSDTAGMNELNQAYRLYLDEDLGNALATFESIVERYTNSFAGTRALVFADRIREKLGRDAKAALDETVNAGSESKLRTLAKSLLVGRLVREGSYDQALNLAIDLTSNPDPLIAKNAIFDAGNIAWYNLDDKTKGTEYFERLIAAYPEHHESFSAQATLGIWEPKLADRGTEAAKEALVTELSLQSYPNPFNPATEIRFAIPEEGLVTLRIYDVLGRVITTLVNENRQAGPHSVRWDASHVPSGVYFSRLETVHGTVAGRLLLVR